MTVILLAALISVCACVWALSRHIRDNGETKRLAYTTPGSRVVILDAGHGDPDGGAVAKDGTSENLINLDIAKRCEALFALFGIKTDMTRTTPSGIWDPDCESIREKKISDIKNRVSLISGYEDAVVISIHLNKFSDSSVRGAQVFYGANGDSKLLAECIQTRFKTILPGSDKKVKPVPDTVYLFSHIKATGVIAECGFLSNPQDHVNIENSDYRETVALAILAGYIEYSKS